MRFAITATDRYLNVLQTFIERGWQPVKVFTCKVDQRLHHNSAVIEFGQRLNVDVQISRMTDANLRELASLGCEALIVASYEWRIGDWRQHLPYAVNFHPAPLPRGRGAYPLPAAILEDAPTWGMSCHRVEHDFDSGAVLKAVEFPLSPAEDHDSLDLRMQLAAKALAADVADHFVEYWNGAVAQTGGSYYPKWTDADRRLDFSQPVEKILRRVRAFGPLECLAHLNTLQVFVRRAVGWHDSHRVPPGTVVHTDNRSLVVAAPDGYVALTEWSLIHPNSVTGSLKR